MSAESAFVPISRGGSLFCPRFYSYKATARATNRSADLFGRSAVFCCRSRTPHKSLRETAGPKEQGSAPAGLSAGPWA